MINLNHTNKTPVNLYVADFKQPFPNNCTILMLHIIPNRKLHTITFQMEYNVAVCAVGPLNSTKIGFGRSAITKTHTPGNTVGVITSGIVKAVEKLTAFSEYFLYPCVK